MDKSTMAQIVIILLFAIPIGVYVISAIYGFIKDSKAANKFFNDIQIGTKLRLHYIDDDMTFNATVMFVDKYRNKCWIKYSDGSESHRDIIGWVGLYEEGWKIVDK